MSIKSSETKICSQYKTTVNYDLEITDINCYSCKKDPGLLWKCIENNGLVCKKCGLTFIEKTHKR